MKDQMQLFDRNEMWELGHIEKCIRGRGKCRYQPCTVVQGVRCCRACMLCGSPCKKAVKE